MFPDISHVRHSARCPVFVMAVSDGFQGFVAARYRWIGPFLHGSARRFPVRSPLADGWAVESGHGMC